MGDMKKWGGRLPLTLIGPESYHSSSVKSCRRKRRQAARESKKIQLREVAEARGELRSVRYGMLDGARVLHTLGGVQDLKANDGALLIVIQDHTGLVLVALFDRHVTEQDMEHIHFGVVCDFHGCLQYLWMRVVR